MDSEKGAEMIIGVSAKKQGGKSTFIDVMRREFTTNKIVRFADKLKEIIIDCFIPPEWNWTIDDLDSDEKKNTALPCGKTVRYLLQIVGTDWFRHTWESCWINAYGKAVFNLTRPREGHVTPVILTPDVRFPNELRYIKEHGGRVFRLTRAPFSSDIHESEVALDPAMWATILHWERHDVDESIQLALQQDVPWVVGMLAQKPDKPDLSDMYKMWQKCPILFDQVIDNRDRTEEEQRQWIVDWLKGDYQD